MHNRDCGCERNLQQIAALTASGCQVVRVAVPSQDDAEALGQIAKKSGILLLPTSTFSRSTSSPPLMPDAPPFESTLGTSKSSMVALAKSHALPRTQVLPIRIGVNAGSLDKRIMEKYGKATRSIGRVGSLGMLLFEEHDFRDIKISVKHHDPVDGFAYELLAEQCDSPAPRCYGGRTRIPRHGQIQQSRSGALLSKD